MPNESFQILNLSDCHFQLSCTIVMLKRGYYWAIIPVIGALQHTSTHCNIPNQIVYNTVTDSHTAAHCGTLQHTAPYCSTLQHTTAYCNTLQHNATNYNTLQHTAAPCNTLQHTATHCNTLDQITCSAVADSHKAHCISMFESICVEALKSTYTRVRCSVLQCVAVCCSVL